MKLKYADGLLFVILIVFYLTHFGSLAGPFLDPDSKGYLEFADQIKSGKIFEQQLDEEVSVVRATRTPGYPILIAISEQILGQGGGTVLALHLFLGLCTLILIPCLLSFRLPHSVSALLVLIGMVDFERYFSLILTEWASFQFLLIYFGLVMTLGFRPNTGKCVCLGLCSAFLVLLRPALIGVLPLTFIVTVLLLGIKTSRFWVVVCSKVAPLLIWSAINWHSIGVFNLNSFDGFNYFGAGALVGAASIQPQDPVDLKDLITFVNSHKEPAPGNERKYISETFSQFHHEQYNQNLYGMVVANRDLWPKGVVWLNKALKTYGLRAIFSDPINYLHFIWVGVSLALGAKWELIFILSLIAYLILHYRSDPRIAKELLVPLLLMFSLHAISVLVCALLTNVNFRYISLTYLPLTIATAAVLIGLTLEKSVKIE